MSNGSAKGSAWKWTADKERAALLLAQGKTWAAIEKEDRIPHSTIGKWVKHPEFQARIDEHHEEMIAEARRILRRNAAKAAQVMVDAALFGNNRHGVRVTAAKDILDRVGLKAPEKQQVEHTGKDGGPIEYSDVAAALDSKLSDLARRKADAAVSGDAE